MSKTTEMATPATNKVEVDFSGNSGELSICRDIKRRVAAIMTFVIGREISESDVICPSKYGDAAVAGIIRYGITAEECAKRVNDSSSEVDARAVDGYVNFTLSDAYFADAVMMVNEKLPPNETITTVESDVEYAYVRMLMRAERGKVADLDEYLPVVRESLMSCFAIIDADARQLAGVMRIAAERVIKQETLFGQKTAMCAAKLLNFGIRKQKH